MRPERWQAIEELYHSASDLPDGQRNSFLQEACGEDQSLLYEVESLLRHGSRSQSVLDTPAMAIMAKAMAADESKSSAPFLPGTTVSHYRILEPIGRGGMGVVYKAEDLKLRRLVALKLLPQFLAADPQALHRFEREAQAASALNHPNICTVYEIDEAEGLHFIAIELLEGETLKERIARGPLEVPEILGIVIEICGALEAAHSAGIIHRDIKPSNIVLMRHDAAKLLDFGVAKRIGPEFVQETEDVLSALPGNVDLRLTSPGAAIGTVAYMSPEQASGQEIDTRSDLFSLGAVLYEMTTGKCPFSGKDLAQVLWAIQVRPQVPVEQLNRKMPPQLIRITKKAMQKDRSLRYQSAGEMRADLQTLRTRLETRASKRKVLLAPTLIVMFFALVVFVSLRVTRVREWVLGSASASAPRQIKSLAVLPFENLSGDPSQDYFADGVTDAVITDMAQIGSLRVISRTSTMHYKGSHQALPEIARELGVDAVVEGSVVRSGNRARITAQLLSTSDRHLWAKAYDRDMREILAVQQDVAQNIVREIQAKLTPTEEARLLAMAQVVNPEAYSSYLLGRSYLRKRSLDGYNKALAQFQHAIEVSPAYAPAYAGLADCYNLLGLGMGSFSAIETANRARAAARKALELDQNLAEAHAALAFTLERYDWNWAEAEKEHKRAIEIEPPVEADIQPMRDIDPLSVQGVRHISGAYIAAKEYDKATAYYKKAIELQPDSFRLRMDLATGYTSDGRYQEAVEEFQKVIALYGANVFPEAELGYAYARWGRTSEAEKIIDDLKKTGKPGYSSYAIAKICAALGRKEETLKWLQRAYRERAAQMSGFNVDSAFASLRSDSRFQDLVRRVGHSGE